MVYAASTEIERVRMEGLEGLGCFRLLIFNNNNGEEEEEEEEDNEEET